MRALGAVITIAAAGLGAFGAIAAPHHASPKHSTPPRSRIAQSGVLSSADLLGIAILALNKPKDAFSVDPTIAYAGRRFAFAQYIKASGDNDESVDATWSYDKDAQAITFSLYSTSLHVMFQSQRAGSYVGQNAFGVKVWIAAYRDTEVVVAPTADSVVSLEKNLTVTTPADASTGRALSQGVRLLIEGELVANGGSVADCSTNDDKATVDDPVEEVTTTCTIVGHIDHIAFVDSSSGKVLQELGSAQEISPRQDEKSGDGTTSAEASSAQTSGNWIHRLDADDIARFYPERAQRMNISGSATLSCAVNANGTLSNCKVTSEAPSDQGFGDAALKLSKLFRLEPPTRGGVPITGSEVTVPIQFDVPKGG